MAVTQIRGNRQIMDGTIYNAQIATGAAIALSKLEEIVIQADGGQAFTANQSMGGNKLTNLGAPLTAGDAVNKSYVDAVAVGLRDFKDSVRVATTGNITLSGTQTIDGVSVIAGERVLVKDQSTASQNGIYDVDTGAWTRSEDADNTPETGEVSSGMYVYVSEGSVNAQSAWVLATVDPIVLDTTSLNFVQFSGAGQLSAGAGLVKIGNTIDVVAAAGGAITVNPDSIQVNVDDSTIAISSNNLIVKDAGITEAKLASSVAGDGLSGGEGSPLTVNVGEGVQIVSGDVSLKLDGNTLTVGVDGLKLSDLSNGYILIGNAGNEAEARRLRTRETPTGAVNGTNAAFVLAAAPVNNSEEVYLNGVLQDVGGSNDYTITGNTITFIDPPETGSKIRVSYIG